MSNSPAEAKPRRRRARNTQSTVLYDALGPRGRRMVLIGTIISALVFAGAVAFFLAKMSSHGQLDGPLWSYVLDPAVQRGLWEGMLNNIKAALVGGAATLVLGLFLALGRLSRRRVIRIPAVMWIEFFRGFPAILLIIFPSLLIPAYFKDINALWYVVLGLTLYNSAVMAEIYRTGIQSLDRGQREAAYSVGLSYGQAMRLVLLPQAIRRMTPLILTQLIILFKDTTLGEVVSYADALRRAETLGAFEPRVVVQAILVAAVMFFLVCFVASRGVAYLEHRQNRRGLGTRRATTAPAAELDPAAGVS